MKNLSISIEKNRNTDINVFQERLKQLIISKNLIPEEEAIHMDLLDLLQYVVIVYLPDTDYKQLVQVVEELQKIKYES